VVIVRALGRYVLLDSDLPEEPDSLSVMGLIIQKGLKQYRISSVGSEVKDKMKVGDIVVLADNEDLLIEVDEGLVATISDNIIGVV
tara:strand:- start:6165 stop:6422 length:258 start_codon:yes stop_codon:yes gene_type:complete